METNPSESSAIHCNVYALTCEFSANNNFASRITNSGFFCSIVGRSFAKVRVIPIISGLNNSVLIHRVFFKNPNITCEYFSNMLNSHYLEYYGLAFSLGTKLFVSVCCLLRRLVLLDCILKCREHCTIFWSSVTVNNAMVCASKWFLIWMRSCVPCMFSFVFHMC